MKSWKLLVPFSVLIVVGGFVYAQGTAPSITDVQVTEVTEDSVTITWQTDVAADSLVNYGLQPNYGIIRIPGANRTEHSVTLEDLDPGRTYFFRVTSADAQGNQGISADYRVETAGVFDADDVTDSADADALDADVADSARVDAAVMDIMEQISSVRDLQQLSEIQDRVDQVRAGITEDVTIVGPPIVTANDTSAVISWATNRPANSVVNYAFNSRYDGMNYEFSRSSSERTEEHEVELTGLTPATEYAFQVQSTDEFNITGQSANFTFTTRSVLPEIRNLRILKVEEESAALAWDTTVPSEALVEYQNLSTGEQNSVGRPTLATSHQMNISDLTFGTRYVAFVIAENASGDRVRSRPIQFITVRDIEPPIISNVTNESTLFPGSESRIQTIVAWNTDEPAYCVLTYQEGVAGGSDEISIESETINYVTNHVQVITDFQPATSYQFWLNCEDESGNMAQSENFVLFTPAQERNIIDLIMENFEQTFGWVQNITN